MVGYRLLGGNAFFWSGSLPLCAAALLSSCEGDGKRAHALERAALPEATPVAPAPGAAEDSSPSAVVLDTGGDEEAPGLQVEGLKVVVLSPLSAKVTWTTPHPADSEVRWGKTVRLEATPILQPEAVLAHCVLLTDLEPGQSYQVQAVSRTAGESTVESDVLGFETVGLEDFTVRKGHPKLYFTADDVPAIKKRIATTHAKAWAALRSTCESNLGKGSAAIAAGRNSAAYARAFSFAGLFGDDARFRRKAEEIGLECARLGGSGEKMDVRQRALGLTSVYDWLFADLTDSARSALRSGLIEMYDRLEEDSNDHEFVWGHSHGNARPMLLIAIALHGESSKAAGSVSELLRAYREGFFATWRNYGDDGGSLKGWWYTTWTLDMEHDVLAAVKSATHLDWYRTESWYGKLADWYLMGLRSDGSFLRSGDSRIGQGLSHLDWEYALSVAHFYRNPRAKWLAHKIEESIDIWPLFNVYDILWNDSDLPAEPPGGSLSQLHRTAGHVLLRDSWGPAPVIADFRSAPDYTLGHTHLDNNSFTIFYRGGLALDSGIYDEFGSSHHGNYYRRTVAHNSILVFDPDEQFTLYGTAYSNDGGQRWRGPGDGIASSFPGRVEETLDPTKGFRAGGILVYEETPELTYALGDAAPSYSRAKLSRFDRHFLWLKAGAGRDKPVIVVFDQVVARKPSFRKAYLLHAQNRPVLQGTVVSTVNGGGILFQTTLYPESPRIEIVGGPGKEFWVNGRNYPPTRDPMELEEAGAWRVEVSPSSLSATDQFLHVLHAGDAGLATAPRCQRLAASSMLGCTVEDWAVLFGTARRGTLDVSYSVPRGSWKHALFGLVPNATYEVTFDGASQGTDVATTRGSLRFDSSDALKIRVTRVAGPGTATSAAPSPESRQPYAPEPPAQGGEAVELPSAGHPEEPAAVSCPTATVETPEVDDRMGIALR